MNTGLTDHTNNRRLGSTYRKKKSKVGRKEKGKNRNNKDKMATERNQRVRRRCCGGGMVGSLGGIGG